MIRSLSVENTLAACGIALAACGCTRSDVAEVPSGRLAVERPVAVIKLPPITALTNASPEENGTWVVRRGDDCFIEFVAQWPDADTKHPFLAVTIEGVNSKGPGVLGMTVLYPKRMADGTWLYRGDPIVFQRLGKYRMKLTNRRVKPPATLFVGSIDFVERTADGTSSPFAK